MIIRTTFSLLSTYLSLLAMLSFCPMLLADTLEIPIGDQAKEKWSLERPIKGMNKQQVEAIFGAPQERKTAVGDPPISSWEYDEYVVYFEWDHVIHTVLKHVAHSEAGQ